MTTGGLEQPAPVGRAEVLLLAALVLAGLIGRASLVGRLEMHVDEPASLLAALQTAETGVPRFPSGVLYTQGLLQSYVVAPFAALGRGTLDDLPLLRATSVLPGTLAMLPAWALGRRAGGPVAGLAVAFALALDPSSLQWSAHLRPYAWLQLWTLTCAWAAAAALGEPEPTARRRFGAVAIACFTLGTFTHVGVLLLWPGLLLAALALHGRALLSARRDVAAGLLAMLGAPVLFFSVNRLAGTSSAGTTDALRGGSLGFVGDHLLALGKTPVVTAWRNLYPDVILADTVMGTVLVCAGAVIVAWSAEDPAPTLDRAARTVAMFGFGTGMTAVAFLVDDPQGRYVLHLVGLAYAVPAVLLAELLVGPPDRMARRALGLGLLGLWTFLFATGAHWRLTHRGVDGVDHRPALLHTAANASPDDPVVLAITPVGLLMLGDRPNTWFLAGPEETPRATRYTRPGPGGVAIDYWAGWPSITSTGQLCAFLEENPLAWFVVDTARMDDTTGWAGSFAEVLTGGTRVAWSARSGVRVLRPTPRARWTPASRLACDRAREGASAVP